MRRPTRWPKGTTTEDRLLFGIKLSTTGCWEFNGGRNPDGYGVIFVEGVLQHAHRTAWEVWRGLVPTGFCVCHHCDNPPCINPKHLFVGDMRYNMLDMVAKNRDNRNRDSKNVGELNGCSKLTAATAREIRIRARNGENQTALANEFGVSQNLISLIKRGKNWSHV